MGGRKGHEAVRTSIDPGRFFFSFLFLFLTIFFEASLYRAGCQGNRGGGLCACISVVCLLPARQILIPLCCDCGLACCSPVSSRDGEINLIGGGEGEGEGCLLAGNEVMIIADDGLRLEWERRLLSFFFLKKDYSML